MVMRDVFDAGSVRILIDEFGKRAWVCINGETVLRLGRITDLEIEDRRVVMSDQETELKGERK